MSIYVEILIHGQMDELWEKTQDPKLHQRWDLRFSEIDCLPRQPDQPQRFLYATRIGGGLRIEGAGESVGKHETDTGQRTSALEFWSEDKKSLIEIGSGYWKYVPGENGIQFITSYDYRTRFGMLGKVIDTLGFRWLIGWATAWSFDRLRLWIESGISPEHSRDRFLIYSLSRLTVALVWFYQGAVPKLLYRSPDELKMIGEAGIPSGNLLLARSLFGWTEVGLALILLLFWRARWPLWFTLAAMMLAGLGVALNSPEYLAAAFNPVTLNLSVAVLAGLALLTSTHMPTASNCRRKPLTT
jgi:hypothetical protein